MPLIETDDGEVTTTHDLPDQAIPVIGPDCALIVEFDHVFPSELTLTFVFVESNNLPHKKYDPFHSTGPPPLLEEDDVHCVPSALYANIVADVEELNPERTHNAPFHDNPLQTKLLPNAAEDIVVQLYPSELLRRRDEPELPPINQYSPFHRITFADKSPRLILVCSPNMDSLTYELPFVKFANIYCSPLNATVFAAEDIAAFCFQLTPLS